MNKRKLLFLSALTGLLLTPAWYTWGSGLFLLIAFVPLLLAEYEIYSNPDKYKKSLSFLIPWFGFFIWNASTLWWLKNASGPGMVFAVFYNSFIATIPFWLFSVTHRKLGNKAGYFSLVFYWLAYEYLYINAEISFTWLNLGNGFANNIKLIQWYEYTGTLGGTLWALISNILLLKIVQDYLRQKSFKNIRYKLSFLLAFIFIPAAISFYMFSSYREKPDPYEIVVIQPNIDPYLKFNDVAPEDQNAILFQLADSLITVNTDYIAAPETFINDNVWLNQLESNPSIKQIRNYLSFHPGIIMVVGATTYKLYGKDEKISPTAKELQDSIFYDSYNTALQIDTSDKIQYYHKSQLVVGVEKMPYPQYLRFLQKIMLRLGGTFRSHGSQQNRACLVSPSGRLKIAPVICYESIFGEFVTDYVTKAGANIIFVITNDGWWSDTPGYIQHNSFSCLRAVETRRSIARSANTGISCFINQKGEILQRIGWWKRSAIRDTLNANDKLTFYVKYGDYCGRISLFAGIFLALYTLVKTIIMRKRKV